MIRAATGLGLSQSALPQDIAALCAPGSVLGSAHDGLREDVRTSPGINTDDTGWRTGGAAAFLMGFCTPLLAVFQIRWRQRYQEVVEMPGACFAGLLGTDWGTSYEAGALDTVEQQKCLSHLLKNLSAVEETRTDRARDLHQRAQSHPARSHQTVAESPGREMRSGAIPGTGSVDPAKA